MVRVKTQDRQQIFLGQLSESDRKTTMARCPDIFIHESFKKSFGVNLINLFSIQLATFNFVKTFGGQKANLPFKRSLLNIDPNANPYSNYFWSINGKELNINNLIEEFVTPLADPRLHLVLNLARKGDYSETLFLMSENIEKQLEILRQETLKFARSSRTITAKSYSRGGSDYVELLRSELQYQKQLLNEVDLVSSLKNYKLNYLFLKGDNLKMEVLK